jgi:Protein of unknown function (DUF2934)
MRNVLGLPQEKFEEICKDVLDRMVQHVGDFVTPISLATDEDRGIAWGTGNYVQLGKHVALMTNAHIYEDAHGEPLCHLPGPTNQYVHCCHHFQIAGLPLDLAIMRLGQECKDSNKAMVPAWQLGERFEPADSELLFLLGFPGSTAMRLETVTEYNVRRVWFGEPISNLAVPVLTQVYPDRIPDCDWFNSTYEVAVRFPAKARKTPGGPDEDLPNPRGTSGSLLWDTKFVASIRSGQDWHPEDARVCGLIRGQQTNPDIRIVTKIEHIRPKLLRFLREEAAYFRWIDRDKKPEGQQLDDWLWAEKTVTSLGPPRVPISSPEE